MIVYGYKFLYIAEYSFTGIRLKSHKRPCSSPAFNAGEAFLYASDSYFNRVFLLHPQRKQMSLPPTGASPTQPQMESRTQVESGLRLGKGRSCLQRK
jgi:hypothetical protein